MSKPSSIPPKLKPFFSLGLYLSQTDGDWRGDCPFCGKEKHFYADEATGQWDCKVCGESGNVVSFLTKFSSGDLCTATRDNWLALSRKRGIKPSAMKPHVLLNPLTDDWLIPCWSETGTVRDIRQWGHKGMRATTGCKTQLWNAQELAESSKKKRVWICEGEWDAIALSWVIRDAELDDIVVGVPGAGIFKKEWVDLFQGREVVAVYDNDQAGDKGQQKCLAAIGRVAKSLLFVNWPEDRPTGFDLRDLIVPMMAEGDADMVLEALESLLSTAPRRGVHGPSPLRRDNSPGRPPRADGRSRRRGTRSN